MPCQWAFLKQTKVYRGLSWLSESEREKHRHAAEGNKKLNHEFMIRNWQRLLTKPNSADHLSNLLVYVTCSNKNQRQVKSVCTEL